MKQKFLGTPVRAAAAVAMMPWALVGGAHAQGQVQATEQSDDTLVDIVVTAQKRSESLQTVPASVTAIDGDALASSGTTDLFQVVKQVPGVVFARAPDDGLGLTFRGLGTLARSHAFEQSVALFTDGVFNGKGRLYTTSMFDVERVEFIKGTQSTLLGKNASLGAINVVFRQPGSELSAEGRAGIEVENGGYVADLAADVPAGDKVAFRIVGHLNDQDGFVTNTATGREGPVHKDLGLRFLMRGDITDGVRLSASYQYSNNRMIGTNFQLVGNIPPAMGEGSLDFTSDQLTSRTPTGDTEHRMRSHSAQAKLEMDVGSNVLTLQTSYINYSLNQLDDFDYANQDTVNFLRTETYRQNAHEIRFQSPSGGNIEYMVGGFYMDSRWDTTDDQEWKVPGFPPAPDPISGQLFNGPYATNLNQDFKAYSAFASGTFRFNEAVRISGGGRYTHETKNGFMTRKSREPYTIWNSFAVPPFDPTSVSHDANFFDGNISLQYDAARDVMLYASFGHGSKSGGYVETNTVAVPPSLLVNGKIPAALVRAGSFIDDEFTKSYEIGLKSMLFDRKLRFNVLGYITDVKDFQDTVFTGGPLGFITTNGPAKSKGFEVDTAYKVNSELELQGNLAYVDATMIIQPIDPVSLLPVVDASGEPVYERYRRSQAPKLSLSGSMNYDRSLSNAVNLHLGATVQHRSSMFNLRQELFPSKALTTVDLSAGVSASDGAWSLNIVAKNIGNTLSEEFAFPSPDPRYGAFYGAHIGASNWGRTVLLTAGFKL